MSARTVAFLSFVAAVIAGLVVAFGLTGTTCSVQGDVADAAATTCRSTNLLEKEGARILVVVAIPVLVAVIPSFVPFRGLRIVAAMLLWVGCVLGILSIGVFFVPAAVLMTVAALMGDRAPARATV